MFLFLKTLLFSAATFLIGNAALAAGDKSYYAIFTGMYDAMRPAIFGAAQQPSFFLIAARVIGLVVAMAGSIFLIIVVVGGIQWMTAGGNDEQVETAQKRVVRACIGLAVVIGGYVIARTLVRVVMYVIG